jgi:RimJ/RimL family protein N-acetyltransferase
MKKTITANLSITEKRIVIRPWEKDDFEEWKKAEAGMAPPQNDFDYPAPRPEEKRTRTEFLKIVRWNNGNIKEGSGFFCGIFLKKDGTKVGTAGPPTIKRCFRTGELAYRIFSPFRGQGYGKEVNIN